MIRKLRNKYPHFQVSEVIYKNIINFGALKKFHTSDSYRGHLTGKTVGDRDCNLYLAFLSSLQGSPLVPSCLHLRWERERVKG